MLIYVSICLWASSQGNTLQVTTSIDNDFLRISGTILTYLKPLWSDLPMLRNF